MQCVCVCVCVCVFVNRKGGCQIGEECSEEGRKAHREGVDRQCSYRAEEYRAEEQGRSLRGREGREGEEKTEESMCE